MVIKGKDEKGIRNEELFSALKESVKGKNLKKVLLVPPDYTRLFSGAGTITSMYYDMLKDSCEIDVLPALGTHEPMTKE